MLNNQRKQRRMGGHSSFCGERINKFFCWQKTNQERQTEEDSIINKLEHSNWLNWESSSLFFGKAIIERRSTNNSFSRMFWNIGKLQKESLRFQIPSVLHCHSTWFKRAQLLYLYWHKHHNSLWNNKNLKLCH